MSFPSRSKCEKKSIQKSTLELCVQIRIYDVEQTWCSLCKISHHVRSIHDNSICNRSTTSTTILNVAQRRELGNTKIIYDERL